jgi:histidinol dehydrogenase
MEFSNPCLKYEARFNLTDSKKIPRNINLIHTDNINALVKREIEKHTNEEKLLIAYNSITQILGIINNLDPELLSILVQSVQPI